jgi:hypothetical protein
VRTWIVRILLGAVALFALGDVVEAVRGGARPPWCSKPLHPRSRLSAADTDELVAGPIRTLRR